MQDLMGLLVVSVEHAVAAPYTSSRLAHAQARSACGTFSDLDDVVSQTQQRTISVATQDHEIEPLGPGAVVRGESRDYGHVPVLDQYGVQPRQEFGSARRTARALWPVQ